MSIPTVSLVKQNEELKLVKERAEELMSLVKAWHGEARFVGPTYWAEENLWLIDAYFDDGEDFELQDRLGKRATDILVEEDFWLGVLCLPLAAYPN